MLKVWTMDALTRAFPLIPGGGVPQTFRPKQTLDLARGERGAVQLCYWFSGESQKKVDVRVAAPEGLKVTARRVGSVPVARFNTATPLEELDGLGAIPGYVPDVLWPDTPHVAAPHQVHAYWLTVEVLPACKPGPHEVKVELLVEKEKPVKPQAFRVKVAKLVAQPRKDFPVTHWFYADALVDWYKLEPWSEPFWDMLDKYLAHYASVGNDVLYVPVFTPPLDGVKTPTQLLGVRRAGKGSYAFDWTQVDRWIEHARKAGITRFEWTHLFSQWGVQHAIRIYEKKNGKDVLLWDPQTPATGEVYRQFLSQFLPEFKAYLTKNKLMDVSMFHLSDEPNSQHLEAYRAARALLKELAPWMKVHDALSHLEFAQEVDMPIPVVKTALQFKEAGVETWCYYCCGPRGRHVNRLLDTPLAKVRIQGWLFHRFGMKGFLHWGYNYWYVSQTTQLLDPFTETDGRRWPNWASGDPFLVYPGKDGPIASIRGEVFALALQDYALLQTLKVDRQDKRLAALKSFDDFPRQRDWTMKWRKQLLRGR